jgi:hypothetical protein
VVARPRQNRPLHFVRDATEERKTAAADAVAVANVIKILGVISATISVISFKFLRKYADSDVNFAEIFY